MGALPCTAVRHHEPVTALRPHTKLYTQGDRERLGLAFVRAREAAGYPARPAFSQVSGVGKTSLFKLEKGDPVGPAVYEAAARALPNWTEDTPRLILEGSPPPPIVTAEQASEEPPTAAPAPIPEPNPADYPDEMEYMIAVYWYLRRGMNMSHEAVMRGFHMAAAIYSRKTPERNQLNTSGNEVG
jgi:hypothetical protein